MKKACALPKHYYSTCINSNNSHSSRLWDWSRNLCCIHDLILFFSFPVFKHYWDFYKLKPAWTHPFLFLQIQLIRKKGVVLIDKVAEFSATRVQHTELFLTEVQTRRDTLQGFDKSMRRLLSADSYLPVLLSDTQNLRKMIKVSQGLKQLKYSDCDLSRPEKPVLVGQRGELLTS